MKTSAAEISAAPVPLAAKIEYIYISPGHNYFGHHGQPAGEHPIVSVREVECLAGRGLAGDRFLDFKKDYAGQITFFDLAVYDELCRTTGVVDKAPGPLRRNIFLRGVDLNALIDREFTLQGVLFSGCRECTPCYWMDAAFAPGTEAFLKNRGGLRAKILRSGTLRVDGIS